MGLNSGRALGKILTNKSVIRSAADNSCRTTGDLSIITINPKNISDKFYLVENVI